MARLPQPTIDAIYKHYESLPNDDRGYLGGSELGEECSRRLWYGFRQVGRARPEGRILRLFESGHREEARVIENLRAIGCTVYDRDEQGRQFRYTECDGHLSGGLDGAVLGLPEAPDTPHLLECKTANKKSFDAMEKDGLAKSKPVHMAQVQLYMGLAGLTRAAYVVVCKDDDRIYLERVEFDAKLFKALLLKANAIIKAETPPSKVSEDPAFFVCKFCPFAELCHGSAMPRAGCRTCIHSSPAKDAKWACAKWAKAEELPMQTGCMEHVFIPPLFETWAEPIDGNEEGVVYKRKDNGLQFVNVANTGFPAKDIPHWSSAQLAKASPLVVCNPAVEAARLTLGGEVEEVKAL
jgi:hypothetical protein